MATEMSLVEGLYITSGLILPLFYVPQILRLHRDTTGAASYSLAKSAYQLLLRVPALLFAVFTLDSGLMAFSVAADILGKAIELGMAVACMHRHGYSFAEIGSRVIPWADGGAPHA